MSRDFRQFYDEATKTISMPKDDIILPEGGLGKFLTENMIKNADKIAQVSSLSSTY